MNRVTRSNLPQSPSLLVDLGVVAFLGALLYGLFHVAQQWHAPLQIAVEINLSLWALPKYTLFSLLRGFTAYLLSLVFALTYGYVAARWARAGKIMVPLLDILQSIPVLGFLPGAVLVLVALFPHSNTGLELVSILMIFTGQVWGIAFSFYHSLRSIPVELNEVSSLYQFSPWQRFRDLELPSAGVGLAWNSMMAMAGGWFFLMICEAFSLGPKDFRLPGLGSYMSVAVTQHNIVAIIAGIISMVIMIVVIDLCVWRPVIAWSQKFRLEDNASHGVFGSRILDWIQRSWILRFMQVTLPNAIGHVQKKMWISQYPGSFFKKISNRLNIKFRVIGIILTVGGSLLALWGGWKLTFLMIHLSWGGWKDVFLGTAFTATRVVATIALGSLWTIPLGIWIGQSDTLCHRLRPVVQVAASFPAPMLYPLVLMLFQWLGWGLSIGSIILMMLGTQWYILFNVIAGASSIPADLKEVSRAYHLTAVQKWKFLWWPAIFPYLITGWVTAAGGAWNSSIVAEFVSMGQTVFMTRGLGSLISSAAGEGRYDLLSAGVLMMAAVVVIVNRYIWKPLYRLAETKYVP